ncbi:pyroglutamyl-peptidase I [uncultured Gemmiger sp.]|uniref:pyroglutamyl-peptidase I n=1 Tax=uncultured Gemmiger sp. TaxID=1623490 RepID=UPI0025EB5A6D|nr:pyroglutamyl-peptidase I [uncultured Gemmiger sp.]
MEYKLLITGFEPFGGQSVNPAWEAVAALPDHIGPFALTRLQVPVEFDRAARLALNAAEALRPDVILCVGQAGGRDAVTPEAAALNLRETEQPDNAGQTPQDQPCVPGGENALFSSLPVRRMVQAIRDAGLPGKLSCSAGTYVCNDLLYTLLHACRGSRTRVGFIHVPFLPEQAKPGVPSLPLADTVRALTAAIRAIDPL